MNQTSVSLPDLSRAELEYNLKWYYLIRLPSTFVSRFSTVSRASMSDAENDGADTDSAVQSSDAESGVGDDESAFDVQTGTHRKAHQEYYAFLNVDVEATHEQICTSYRRLSRLFHPDKHGANGSDAAAAASLVFKRLNHVYRVLSDQRLRVIYDAFGETGVQKFQADDDDSDDELGASGTSSTATTSAVTKRVQTPGELIQEYYARKWLRAELMREKRLRLAMAPTATLRVAIDASDLFIRSPDELVQVWREQTRARDRRSTRREEESADDSDLDRPDEDDEDEFGGDEGDDGDDELADSGPSLSDISLKSIELSHAVSTAISTRDQLSFTGSVATERGRDGGSQFDIAWSRDLSGDQRWNDANALWQQQSRWWSPTQIQSSLSYSALSGAKIASTYVVSVKTTSFLHISGSLGGLTGNKGRFTPSLSITGGHQLTRNAVLKVKYHEDWAFLPHASALAQLQTGLHVSLIHVGQRLTSSLDLNLSLRSSYVGMTVTSKLDRGSARARCHISAGFFGLLLKYGVERRVSSITWIGASVSLNLLTGVAVHLKVRRARQNYVLPITLAPDITWEPVVCATVAPVVLCFVGSRVFALLLAAAKRQHIESRDRQSVHSTCDCEKRSRLALKDWLDRRTAAVAATSVLESTSAASGQCGATATDNGIHVVAALYGRLPVTGDADYDERWHKLYGHGASSDCNITADDVKLAVESTHYTINTADADDASSGFITGSISDSVFRGEREDGRQQQMVDATYVIDVTAVVRTAVAAAIGVTSHSDANSHSCPASLVSVLPGSASRDAAIGFFDPVPPTNLGSDSCCWPTIRRSRVQVDAVVDSRANRLLVLYTRRGSDGGAVTTLPICITNDQPLTLPV